jgi:hypothetical protein
MLLRCCRDFGENTPDFFKLAMLAAGYHRGGSAGFNEVGTVRRKMQTPKFWFMQLFLQGF